MGRDEANDLRLGDEWPLWAREEGAAHAEPRQIIADLGRLGRDFLCLTDADLPR
jgi:hypothetical protein